MASARSSLAFSILVGALGASGPALALPPTYGTEFNLTNIEIEKSWRLRGGGGPGSAEQEAAQSMAEKIRAICGDCSIEEHSGKFGFTEYRVKFPDGWGFNISVDPACVEIQTLPATAVEIRAQMGRMERYIFFAAQQTGLQATPTRGAASTGEGSAHLNIGLRSAFEDDPRGFMRFLVDYANRPGLGSGLLGRDSHNAPLMSELSGDQRKAFRRLAADVSSGKVTRIEDIIHRMNFEVYTRSPDFGTRASSGRHYQAIGLKQLIKPEFQVQDMPFELRAIRQPGTVQEYALLTELMDAKIARVRNLGDAEIRFVESDRFELIHHRANAAVQALEFALYTEEVGLRWKKFESLLNPRARDVLERGFVERLFSGSADWSAPSTVPAFTEVLVRGALTSEFLEKKLFEVLELPTTPGTLWTTTLEKLVEQSEKNAEVARYAEAIAARILDRERIHGRPLLRPADPYLAQIRKNRKTSSLIERCRRFLQALVP